MATPHAKTETPSKKTAPRQRESKRKGLSASRDLNKCQANDFGLDSNFWQIDVALGASIVKERKLNGQFKSWKDLAARVDSVTPFKCALLKQEKYGIGLIRSRSEKFRSFDQKLSGLVAMYDTKATSQKDRFNDCVEDAFETGYATETNRAWKYWTEKAKSAEAKQDYKRALELYTAALHDTQCNCYGLGKLVPVIGNKTPAGKVFGNSNLFSCIQKFLPNKPLEYSHNWNCGCCTNSNSVDIIEPRRPEGANCFIFFLTARSSCYFGFLQLSV
jgi:hypothetical protein